MVNPSSSPMLVSPAAVVSAKRWTGNGMADGNTVTSTNVNTTGNGDMVARAVSGAPLLTFAGDGFSVIGGAADIGRLDLSTSATKAAVAQIFLTVGSTPTIASERAIAFNGSGASGNVRRGTNGTFSLANASNVVIIPSQTPSWVVGHKYQIDVVNALSSTPTTANGRIFYNVKDLTDPSWNTTGEFFYDTGYTQNLGTTDITTIHVGKTANGALSSADLFEQVAWSEIVVNSADLSQTTAKSYFIAAPSTGSAPSASAGADISIESGDTFTLTGTYTDSDSNVMSQTWARSGGITTSGKTRTEIAPIVLNDTALVYTYTVTDNDGLTSSDSLTVVVRKSLLIWWDPARGDVPLVIDQIEPEDLL